jgi:putative peptidoglycan lipid II flippase
VGAWLEWALLRRRLRGMIGTVGAGGEALARMFGAAALGALAGYAARVACAPLHPSLAAVVVAAAFGAAYLGAAYALGLGEARVLTTGVLRRLVRR